MILTQSEIERYEIRDRRPFGEIMAEVAHKADKINLEAMSLMFARTSNRAMLYDGDGRQVYYSSVKIGDAINVLRPQRYLGPGVDEMVEDKGPRLPDADPGGGMVLD